MHGLKTFTRLTGEEKGRKSVSLPPLPSPLLSFLRPSNFSHDQYIENRFPRSFFYPRHHGSACFAATACLFEANWGTCRSSLEIRLCRTRVTVFCFLFSSLTGWVALQEEPKDAESVSILWRKRDSVLLGDRRERTPTRRCDAARYGVERRGTNADLS